MKSYPSISTFVDLSLHYHVFDKLDGSNIRAEWTPKRGFYKFGSRTELLSEEKKTLWPAVSRIQQLEGRMGESLSKLRTERAVCFFEWVGPLSFAGSHYDKEEDMSLVLLDVALYKQPLMAPKSLIEFAQRSEVATPKLLHQGRIDKEFLESVRQGHLPGITAEGVVGKGPITQKTGGPVMFKHKTQAWYDRLKTDCGENESLFEKLR